MLVGYARTATGDENLEEQLRVLKQAGCQRIFADQILDHKFEQPGLRAAHAFMRAGDTLIIWRLDRLGRSLKEVIQKVEELHREAIGFRSMEDEIDTTQPEGQYQIFVFSALVRCQRNLIRQRTRSGLRAARARGRMGGRKREMTPVKVQQAARLMKEPDVSIREICATLGVAKSTLYRYVSPKGDIRIP